MKKLLTILGIIFAVFVYGSVNAQMYEKDGRHLNSAGGNIFGDSMLNPMADPMLNPMADPDLNPMGDAYMRNDGTMGLRSEDQ